MVKRCAAPGCNVPLGSRNTVGVCRKHLHSRWCQCVTCRIKRGEFAEGSGEINVLPISEVPPDLIEADQCRALWMTLLKGLWDDVFDARRSFVAARDARRWFGSRDFFIVCNLCGLDGHAVLAKYKEALAALEGVAA